MARQQKLEVLLALAGFFAVLAYWALRPFGNTRWLEAAKDVAVTSDKYFQQKEDHDVP